MKSVTVRFMKTSWPMIGASPLSRLARYGWKTFRPSDSYGVSAVRGGNCEQKAATESEAAGADRPEGVPHCSSRRMRKHAPHVQAHRVFGAAAQNATETFHPEIFSVDACKNSRCHTPADGKTPAGISSPHEKS